MKATTKTAYQKTANKFTSLWKRRPTGISVQCFNGCTVTQRICSNHDDMTTRKSIFFIQIGKLSRWLIWFKIGNRSWPILLQILNGWPNNLFHFPLIKKHIFQTQQSGKITQGPTWKPSTPIYTHRPPHTVEEFIFPHTLLTIQKPSSKEIIF